MISIRRILLNMFFLAGKISQPLNKVCCQTTHPELNNNESNLTYELLGSKGTPLNKVCSSSTHPELNNNDLNSLYVNEPGLSTRFSRRQCTAIAHEVRRGRRGVHNGTSEDPSTSGGRRRRHDGANPSCQSRRFGKSTLVIDEVRSHDAEQNSTTRWADITRAVRCVTK